MSNFHVQYVLRAYSRQLANRTRVSKGYKSKEEVDISAECKKRLLVDKVIHEIIGQFAGGIQLSERCRNILEQLSHEYGLFIEISNDEGAGILFKMLDEKTGEMKVPSAFENARLEKRLYEIAQSTVYSDLTESININTPDRK